MNGNSQEDVKKEFIETWIERAARENEAVDEGDKFMCIWVAFNAWLKGEYSETASDSSLIESVKQNQILQNLFEELKNNEEYDRLLTNLTSYRIRDMRDPENESKMVRYDDSFETLISTLYRIRCNLFHGRKNIKDTNEYKLVTLARKILYELFKNYVVRHLNIGHRNT
mgnify:CR=1 FL=1